MLSYVFWDVFGMCLYRTHPTGQRSSEPKMADNVSVTVFKKLTNTVVEDTDFINVLLTRQALL